MDDLSRHARRVVNAAHDLVAGYGESVISPPIDVETSDAIRKTIADEHHLPMKNVLLACTHTHSGPGKPGNK